MKGLTLYSIISLTCFALALVANATPPNIIVIISDDQRWDATGYMQSRLATDERIARFPWLIGTTPNLDRLCSEGIHFDNAFTVFSTCSPSRATMLTGLYPHLHGVTNNQTPFPVDSVTYASLLKNNGYATGYFGKWHHGRQTDRPGFDDVATFYGQGSYFETKFYNGNDVLIRETGTNEWVDDVSTDYAINFINQKTNEGIPFLLVLGFKTPHQPFDPPSRTASIYDGESALNVPNLNTPPPGQTINVNSGNYASSLRKYMSTIAGIDNCVGRLMDQLESLNIENNTAIIFISDNGFFRGEHKLGDKRAPYEESIRIPFIIKYPKEQTSPATVNEIALNLDLAPTILDIAGLSIPENMQGLSLLPIIRNEAPNTWRNYFFYQYNHDPEYPTAKARPYIALRHENGLKIVEYEENKSWSEFFDTEIYTDPYEIDNLFNNPSMSDQKEQMQNILLQEMASTGFLKPKGISSTSTESFAEITLGKNYNFSILSSSNLNTWSFVSQVQGNGSLTNYSLTSPTNNGFQIIVNGNPNDYDIINSNFGTAQNFQGEELIIGAPNPWDGVTGGDAIFIFEIPVEEIDFNLNKIEFEFVARRKWIPSSILWNANLETLGIYSNTNPFLTHSQYTSNNPNIIMLEEAILTPSFPNVDTIVQSDNELLLNYIRDFYTNNQNYAGGKYIFLRISADRDPETQAYKFYLKSSNSSQQTDKPKLKFYYNEISENPDELYYKVIYGEN